LSSLQRSALHSIQQKRDLTCSEPQLTASEIGPAVNPSVGARMAVLLTIYSVMAWVTGRTPAKTATCEDFRERLQDEDRLWDLMLCLTYSMENGSKADDYDVV
jgi:hypothetical protein